MLIRNLKALILSTAIGFTTPWMISAAAPAPAAVPIAAATQITHPPCDGTWTLWLNPGCFCVLFGFGVISDAENCGMTGEKCEGVAFWEVCGISGSSGTHYLNCEDSTKAIARCYITGGAAVSVELKCIPCIL